MRCVLQIMAATGRLTCGKIECDGARKSGRDKRGEHLIERPKEGECTEVVVVWGVQTMDEWMDGGSDVERVPE